VKLTDGRVSLREIRRKGATDGLHHYDNSLTIIQIFIPTQKNPEEFSCK
jgi:hypothetical protein